MEDVYAAGDIATYTDWRTGEEMRIEHWRTALQQGRIAARNMIGKKEKNKCVPFFWTAQPECPSIMLDMLKIGRK